MPTRLRLAMLLAAMAVVVQPAAAPRPTVAVTTRAHRSVAPRDALTSLAIAKARLDAFTRDEPSDALRNRTLFDGVAVGMAALVVACRRRLVRRLAAVRVAWAPRNWVSVRGPPFAS
jgi:hypothetical protein